MTTDAQSAALSALKLGAFLTPVDIIAGLATEDQGEDVIVLRRVMAPLAPTRLQRWRVPPDGAPRLVLDGTRLN